MNIKAYLAASGLKQSDIAADVPCDPSFISRLCTTDKPLPLAAAIAVYRKRGVKLDPIASASDDEIDVMERWARGRR